MLYILQWRLQRLRDPNVPLEASAKRYVITNPPYDFGLLPTDQVRRMGFTLEGYSKAWRLFWYFCKKRKRFKRVIIKYINSIFAFNPSHFTKIYKTES